MEKKVIIRIFTALSLLVFAVSTTLFIRELVRGREEVAALTRLAEQKQLFEQGIGPSFDGPPLPEPVKTIPLEAAAEPLAPQQPANPYQQNKDMVGWIQIEGTLIDYPVMYTGDDFYLTHNFERKTSKSGLPYIDRRCTANPLGTNTFIHGHNMKNGTMFSQLLLYAEESFYLQHSSFDYSTEDQKNEYEIVAVIQTRLPRENEQNFLHFNFFESPSAADFEKYVAEIKALSLYDTNVTAQPGDQLITLSTCSSHTENGRFLVIARKQG